MRSALLTLILFSELLFPQFTQRDSSLLRSLFFRTSEPKPVLQYLHAQDSDSVKAGLLAAGNMPHADFIPVITALPFAKYGSEISFALGKQISSGKISDYLWSNFSSGESVKLKALAVETLGLTGSMEDFDRLYKKWLPGKKLPGVSNAIFHFRSRQIKTDSIQKKILLEELSAGNTERKLSALFTLNRFGISSDFKKIAENYLAQVRRIKNEDVLTGLLQLYRRNTDSLRTLLVIKPYLSHRNFSVRTEAINSLKHYHFTKQKDFETLGKLLTHQEDGTVFQTAQQIRQNTFSEKASAYLTAILKKRIDVVKSSAVSQEYILTLLYLNPAQGNQLLADYEANLNRCYWYMAQGVIGTTVDKLLEFTLPDFPGLDLPARLQSFSQIFTEGNQKQLLQNPLFEQYIRMIISIGDSPLISTFADGAIQELIMMNPDYYKSGLLNLFKKRIDDANFNEALISIFNFLTKYFPDEKSEFQKIAGSSKLNSIASLSGQTPAIMEDEERIKLFNELLQNSFTYKGADIETDEGVIRIEFNHGIAPFSAGNFVKLSKDGFFNGILFHRVVPGFVIQAGDRTGTGWGGPGYEIISEYSWLPYIPGTLGMASAGKDTEGSQWFITQWYYPHLNGRYTVFGSVTGGIDAVNRIPQGTYIRRVTLR